MDNKCYAKFMADMMPRIEALQCEKETEALHTYSGQLKPANKAQTAKFKADVVPLVEALLKCEAEQKTPHTVTGQLKEGHMLEETPNFKGCMAEKLAGSKPGNRMQATENFKSAAKQCARELSPVAGMPCKECGSKLKGQWNKELKRWTLFCPECKRIRYKSTDVGVGGKESYVEVDLPWKDE